MKIRFPNYKENFIVPSVLSADFTRLAREIKGVEKYSGWIQVDIMDGHFVPNLSFGPHITRNLRTLTRLPLDAHLMVQKPMAFIEPFRKAGADLITVHLESENFPEALKEIKRRKLKAGLALRPKTPLAKAGKYLKEIDLLLVMTVEPGFGGQEFIGGMLDKIKAAKKIRENEGLSFHIQADGGVNEKTAFDCLEAGANSLVMGSALFSRKNPAFIKALSGKIKKF
ncbi:MAG: ribulose-phosphate 3-epimerase [Elusimicrobia bacterium CG08_land_8_20_14_0_20_51_18]|nr:MAG: ribulose-phosphate 3-epimerase [Elusimicrobia bacterium CG08_land_8_20_14_0_20_51_18]